MGDRTTTWLLPSAGASGFHTAIRFASGHPEFKRLPPSLNQMYLESTGGIVLRVFAYRSARSSVES